MKCTWSAAVEDAFKLLEDHFFSDTTRVSLRADQPAASGAPAICAGVGQRQAAGEHRLQRLEVRPGDDELARLGALVGRLARRVRARVVEHLA